MTTTRADAATRGRRCRNPLAAALIVSALLTGCSVLTCDETDERSVSTPSEGIDTVRIIAEAGSLDVGGRPGTNDIAAEGTACASTTGDLEELQFEVTTSGSEVVIEAKTPDNTRFDLRITVPDAVRVKIDDGSGNIEVRDVAGVEITDGSGDVYVAGVSGDLVVTDDGSGDLDLRAVGGGVEVEADGSGGIMIADVEGDVRIGADGSGEIRITAVGGDVRIGADGSGSISVTEVGGDFRVDDDGSGSISFDDVRGAVDIPGS